MSIKAQSYFAKQALLVKLRVTALLKRVQMRKKLTRMTLSVTFNLKALMTRHSKLLAMVDNTAKYYSKISIKITNGRMSVIFNQLALYLLTMPFSLSMNVISTR